MERLFFILIGFCLFSTNVFGKVCGQVIQTTGRVEILKTQNNSDLERYAQAIKAPHDLLCTDIILTQGGSRAKIKLVNGIITLGPNTRIAISKVVKNSSTPSVLNLTYGKMRTFFKSESSTSQEAQFKVKTSTAVIGVRGTDFYVKFDPNKDVTNQATLKGQVEVEQIATKQKVLVNTGQQVDVVDFSKKEPLTNTTESLKEVENSSPSESKENLPLVLEVKPIETHLVSDIQQTSALVKADEAFTSPEAVKVLGSPENWIPPKDEIPGDLKEIDNIF